MGAATERLTSQLFGLDRAEVDAVLEQQVAVNAVHEQALHQVLVLERAKLGQVRAHIVAIEHQAATQRALAAQLEEALRRADETAPIIAEAVEQRARLLEHEAFERQRGQRLKIDGLTEQVRLKLRQLESATEEIHRLAPPELPAEAATESRDAAAGPAGVATIPAAGAAPKAAPQATSHATPFATPQPALSVATQAAPPQAPPVASHPAPPAATPTLAPAPSPAQVETGLRSRISANVAKMLAGKIVGEDLRDAAGRVIAKRGAAITPELAAEAESAGLLAELILHMAWSEGTGA